MKCKSLLLILFSFIMLSCRTTNEQTQPARSSPPIVSPSVPSSSNVIIGEVVAISDGDTLTVLDATNTQHRIRLQGIDAPESRQDFGTVSRQHLADAVFRRNVVVEFEERDRYGRILGKILLDGRDINLEQIRAGLAWHYKQYERDQSPEDRRLYVEAEESARAQRI